MSTGHMLCDQPRGKDTRDASYSPVGRACLEGPSEALTEKAMAPHSSGKSHSWKIPWTEEPGRLQSMRSLRVGPD